MSTVAPFDYTRLVFTCILAYLITGDLPQHTSQYVGYTMIIVSGAVLVTAEKEEEKGSIETTTRESNRKCLVKKNVLNQATYCWE